MKPTIFLLVGLGLALPAAAAPTVPLKCGANQERIWVYDNLNSWDVSVRLKCGTPVDVLGLEKGYVKVRTDDGNEGYVPADDLPSSEMAALTAAASPAPVVPSMVTVRVSVQPVRSAAIVAPPTSAIPARDLPTVAAAVTVAAQVNETPTPVERVAAAPPAVLPTPTAPPAEQAKPAPAYVPAPMQAPVPARSVPPVTRMAAAPVRQAPAVVVEGAYAANVPFAAAPVAAVVRAADVTPLTKSPAISASVRGIADIDDDDDMPEIDAAPSEDLSACNVFFSAYGLTPMQSKWIAADRLKKFPGVCPAPEPSMVDYVVIFTHDTNFFSTTMPDTIHTDKNGFSDWTPVTPADDTLVSSQDKAHREYAWVFHIRRGTFDPSKFSSRRRPQFTKAEASSHASSKTVEDAIGFIAQAGPQ